ncbi:MAG: alcohol dehydrogenase, partial [Actinomycetales bacterium]
MKAVVYHGVGKKSWEEVPDPKIKKTTDALVRIDTTTICGTDLHILKGDVSGVEDGRVLGHEGVGTVLEVGDDVKNIKVGDRVIISCISKCMECRNCKAGLPAHCETSSVGWILGHLIDGTQAEMVRIPYADNSLIKLPESVSDEQAVMLSDILPTGYEIGVLAGKVKEGDIVAVVGAGPVGLAAMMTAAASGAEKVIAVDADENRLELSKQFGATNAVKAGKGLGSIDKVKQLSRDGRGVDVAIEAVGIPVTLQNCFSMVRPGGHVSNVGVHGEPVEIDMERDWIKNLTLSMGLVNATTTEDLLAKIESGAIAPE